jgi:RTX calcium-binding nonapeptide repeat (4 copies)
MCSHFPGRSSYLSFARAVPLALVLALAAPAAAHADATITTSGIAPHRVVTFTVQDARDHTTSISQTGGDLVIRDDVGISVGASSCVALDAHTAECVPGVEFDRVVFAFGSGNDQFGVSGYFTTPISVDGGAGDDALHGGAGDDELAGGDGGDYLNGDVGADVLDGGAGDDDLQADELPAAADAAIACGPGVDSVTFDDVDPPTADCEIFDPPMLAGDVRIVGDPQVGNALGLLLPENVGGDGTATFQWERCSTLGYGCAYIPGATGQSYTPTASDVGSRLRVFYGVENALGDDWRESEPTAIVHSASAPRPPRPRPPTVRVPVPRPPAPRASPPVRAVFAAVAKPKLVVKAGHAIVDTGRRIACPTLHSSSCTVTATARLAGASARLRGRPPTPATATRVVVADGASIRVALRLNTRTYRLLRIRHKLTLSVTWRISRPIYGGVGGTFQFTVKAPARKRASS